MAPLSPNQFAQTPEVGFLDLQTNGANVVTAIHLSGQATPLVLGQPVKLVDNSTPIPSVQASAIGEIAWGVVVRNFKRANFPAEMPMEIARTGSVIYLQASGAIARGASVQYDPATNKVATKAAGAVLGQAFDKAVAADDIIRVTINPAAA